MPLRIAFDLDGVLADMDGELVRQAHLIFTDTIKHEVSESSDPNPPTPRDAKPPATAPDSSTAPEPDISRLHLTPREERRLWQHVSTIENFWEGLQEIEPGTIRRIATLAAERRWEIIFLTKRPQTAGNTAQLQSQRWLESNGFKLPSVFVVQASRGRIAAALGLDFVIDDRPENCLDVVVDSKARAILVWRDGQGSAPNVTKRMGIGVVRSMRQCLDILAQVENAPGKPKVIDRVMRLLGLKEPA